MAEQGLTPRGVPQHACSGADVEPEGCVSLLARHGYVHRSGRLSEDVHTSVLAEGVGMMFQMAVGVAEE